MEGWRFGALRNYYPTLTNEIERTQVLGTVLRCCVGVKWELAVSTGVLYERRGFGRTWAPLSCSVDAQVPFRRSARCARYHVLDFLCGSRRGTIGVVELHWPVVFVGELGTGRDRGNLTV